MKGSRSTNNRQNKQGNSHKPRPEIRDDLDSHKVQRTNYTGDKRVKKKGARKKAKAST